MASNYFYWHIIISDSGPDLLPISTRTKHGVRRSERDLAHRGHTRGHCHQVLLGHSYLHKPLWIFFGKEMHLGAFSQISAKADYIFVLVSCYYQTLPKAFSNRLLLYVSVKKFTI